MRIVHCFRAPVGGVFRHVRDLAEYQSAQGNEVGLICDQTTGGAFEDKLLSEIEPHLALGITRIAMQRRIGFGDIGAAFAANRVLKKLQPDIVHGHGAKGGVIARLSRAPGRFYSPHGGSLHYDVHSLKGRLFFAVERWLERKTDGLIFVCAYERDTYIEKVGSLIAPSTIAYNGLHEHEFSPVATVPDASDLLFIGTLRDLKGPDLFIEAVALAQARLGRTITAEIVGDGEMEAACKALVARHHLDANVKFRPAMPARKAFALANIVVVPSRAESFPYIVLEALAAQRALIATDVGGIPEILRSDSPALTKPDAHALAEKIAAFVADPAALQSELPDHLQLRRKYSVKAMSETVLSAYRQARQ